MQTTNLTYVDSLFHVWPYKSRDIPTNQEEEIGLANRCHLKHLPTLIHLRSWGWADCSKCGEIQDYTRKEKLGFSEKNGQRVRDV